MATSASTSKPTDTSQPVDTSKVENPAAVGVLEEDDEFEEFAVAGLQTCPSSRSTNFDSDYQTGTTLKRIWRI